MSAIALLGSAGVGKSAVLRELEVLGWVCADVDRASARVRGVSYEEFFTEHSQEERLAAQYAMLDLLLGDVEEATTTDFAIAIPAECLGTVRGDAVGVAFAERMQAMESLFFVQLTADLGSLVTRNGLIGARSSNVVLPRRELRSHLALRQPVWDELADFTVDTTHVSPAAMAERIVELLPA